MAQDGITLKALANMCGYCEEAVRRMLTGGMAIKLEMAATVTAALGLSLDAICGIITRKETGQVRTNADVIREMTDDQLYEFLSALKENDIDYSITFCDMCDEDRKSGGEGNALNYDCDDCFKNWIFGSSTAYNGLETKRGLNSGYVEVKDET